MASTFVLPGTTIPHTHTHRQHGLNRSFKMESSSAGHLHSHDNDHDHGHAHAHSHDHFEPHSHGHGFHAHRTSTIQPRQSIPAPLLTGNGLKTTSTSAGKQLITPATPDQSGKYEAPEAKLPEPAHDHSAERSKFTRMLLPYTSKWPILHAVMTEKDSRRIFYFMRYCSLRPCYPMCLGY